MLQETPNINHFWATLLVEELIRNGLTQFCISPGSRSTPLTTAIANHPKAHTTVHFDERSSAFYALGHSRGTGKPAVWVTTSGTAVANGLPAVVEAHQDRVPLLLLTADRPPELQATDANQTISQTDVFRPFLRWQANLPCPTSSIDPAVVLTTVNQALSRTVAPAGPVHLNCAFREPLALIPAANPLFPAASLETWKTHQKPYTTYAKPIASPDSQSLADIQKILSTAKNGLIIVGQLPTQIRTTEILQLATQWGWPVFPDIGSRLRLVQHPHLVSYYDAMLGIPNIENIYQPDVVLQFGSRFVSKRLQQFLARVRPATHIAIKHHPERSDPNHLVTHSLQANIVLACQQHFAAVAPPPAQALSYLQTIQQNLSTFFRDNIYLVDTFSEPAIAQAISKTIPPEHNLSLGNSMPVRDMDTFAQPTNRYNAIGLNRGASGIDGTLASAYGFAHGRGRPTTLIIGDLALLHDLNALAFAKTAPQPVTIIVINNNGGGIFSFLPIAEHPALFESYFGTPHGFTFAAAANMFGLPYSNPKTLATFKDVYQIATQQTHSTLIEIQTNRTENHKIHQDIEQAMNHAFSSVL